MRKYDLYIFDFDGTITMGYKHRPNHLDIAPNVLTWFRERPAGTKVAIASNQGGVGTRLAMEEGGWGQPTKYPTEDSVLADILKTLSHLPIEIGEVPLYISYRSQFRDDRWSPVPKGCEYTPEWSMSWRKPNPGMLMTAMLSWQCPPSKSVFVGDQKTDEQAAAQAGIDFVYAKDFFVPQTAALI